MITLIKSNGNSKIIELLIAETDYYVYRKLYRVWINLSLQTLSIKQKLLRVSTFQGATNCFRYIGNVSTIRGMLE